MHGVNCVIPSMSKEMLITENSESAAIRCADVVHHVFHVDPTLTWDNIKRKLAQSYPHLAERM